MTVWDSMALNAPHTEREIRSIHETGAGDLPTKLDGFPLLEEAIKEHFGQRCDEYMAGCPCCDTWAELDRLRAIRAAEARELAQDGDESNIKKPDIAMRCAECDCANGGDECNWFGSPMAIITALRAEIDRCHERLEIKRMHRMDLATGETTPVDVPLQERASLPDGIDCRDETIRLLRDNIETLRNNNAQLLAQLRELAQDGEPAPGSTTETENVTCQSAGGFGGAEREAVRIFRQSGAMIREAALLLGEAGNDLTQEKRAYDLFKSAAEFERDQCLSFMRTLAGKLAAGKEVMPDAAPIERGVSTPATSPGVTAGAVLSAIAAEKAEWPHAGSMHDGARMACDAIAKRVKKLMGSE